MDGVSTLAEHLAEKVAPQVKKHGAKLIPESMKSKDGEPSNFQGAKFVAARSLQGDLYFADHAQLSSLAQWSAVHHHHFFF